jgi:uncharacterized protein
MRTRLETSVKIPASVARKIGHYVYIYINPIDGKPFYVGKGRGRRAVVHLDTEDASRKAQIIRQLRDAGVAPRIEILAHGLKDEETAFRIEAAVIDALGLPSLSNAVRGWKSVQLGRMPLGQLISFYQRRPIKLKEPSILIRINQLYRPGMSEAELYDATRGVWKVGDKRGKARYAFAVFEGIVREVYEISQWLPAGSTLYTRPESEVRVKDRWEFVGRLAPEAIRRRYRDRDVRAYFPSGAQNPIAYVNVD